MKFKLEFDMDNAAFEDSPANEVAHILRTVALRIEGGRFDAPESFPVQDSNGNSVGKWSVLLK